MTSDEVIEEMEKFVQMKRSVAQTLEVSYLHERSFHEAGSHWTVKVTCDEILRKLRELREEVGK